MPDNILDLARVQETLKTIEIGLADLKEGQLTIRQHLEAIDDRFATLLVRLAERPVATPLTFATHESIEEDARRRQALREEERRHSDAMLEKLRLSLVAADQERREHLARTARLAERVTRVEQYLGISEESP